MNLKYKRFFNTLQISDDQAEITKTSQNTSKLLDEINWYLRIPEQLRKYIPAIKESSRDPIHPFITLEYYKFSLLAELYVTNALTVAQWDQILQVLIKVQHDLGNFRQNLAKSERINRLNQMYLKKTLDRLSQLYTDRKFKRFFKNSFKINNLQYPPLDQLTQKLNQIVATRLLLDIPEFRVIHGDYILSNILFDLGSLTVKLIDPRGNFGVQGIYGDPRYEYAKLIHSLEGYYELIINDLFKVTVEGLNINYEILPTSKQKEIRKLSERLFANIEGFKRGEIQLIEGLLFLSMVPLHHDSYPRQLTMLAQGVEKFYQITS